MSYIISSVKVDEEPGHDRVRVWNRGGLAGELVVTKGDGQRIAAMLRAPTLEPLYTCRYSVQSESKAQAFVLEDERGRSLGEEDYATACDLALSAEFAVDTPFGELIIKRTR